MAKYQTWSRLAVLIVCSASISGCLDDEPSAADIKASFFEAYGCAPELFNEIKVTNVIPNNEHTKYIDFEWSISYNPPESIIALMNKVRESGNKVDTENENAEKISTYARVYEAKKVLEVDKVKLDDGVQKSNIYKCYMSAQKASGLYFSGGFIHASDNLGETISRSASQISYAIMEKARDQDSEYIINNLLTKSWSIKRVLMIKTKNGWRFDSTGTD